MFLVESGADVKAENVVGTTPLAAADNAFISKEGLEEFNESRAFLKECLSARGGKPGR